MVEVGVKVEERVHYAHVTDVIEGRGIIRHPKSLLYALNDNTNMRATLLGGLPHLWSLRIRSSAVHL